MNPRPFRFSFLAIALLALGACRSSGSKDAVADYPCTCGTPEAAFDGCLHTLCADGKRNPDNPECVCGPIPIGAEDAIEELNEDSAEDSGEEE